MVLVHADAVNVARRLSNNAENDLLQENLFGKCSTYCIFLRVLWDRLDFAKKVSSEICRQ